MGGSRDPRVTGEHNNKGLPRSTWSEREGGPERLCVRGHVCGDVRVRGDVRVHGDVHTHVPKIGRAHV